MKHLVFLLCLTLSGSALLSQISTVDVEEAKPYTPIKDAILDKNFLGRNNVRRYIGQRLYLNEVPESLREYHYKNFYKDIECKKVFKKKRSSFVKYSDYEYLAKRYFDVVDIHSNGPFIFELRDVEKGETIYFKYRAHLEREFEFIVGSYYESIKKRHIGNEIILSERALHSLQYLDAKKRDIDVSDTEWKCLDVTIERKYFDLILILADSGGEKAFIRYDALYDIDKELQRAFLKSEAKDYAERFGDEAWGVILKEKVRVGFTEEMVLLSWGKPKSINRASYGDQWVYNGRYIYFRNGVMSSFN